MSKLSEAIWLLVSYAQRNEASNEDVERDAQGDDVDKTKQGR